MKLQKQFYRSLLLKRKRNIVEKCICAAFGKFSPAAVRNSFFNRNELIAHNRISIISPSDNDDNHFRRLQWGDYWAKYELTKALGELGYLVTDECPDVVIHLFGAPTDLPESAYKILWIYSHPEAVSSALLKQYDRIFCLSSSFTQKIRDMGFDAEWAPGATSRHPLDLPDKYDLVFVGNNRGDDRQELKVLGELPCNVKVWGDGWEGILPERCLGGKFYDYAGLPFLYSSAKVSLNTHWPEMNREGFVSLRVFDILGSGGVCLSDANTGLEEIFGDSVPQFQSMDEMKDLINYYTRTPERRIEAVRRAQGIAQSFSWLNRASQLTKGLSPLAG